MNITPMKTGRENHGSISRPFVMDTTGYNIGVNDDEARILKSAFKQLAADDKDNSVAKQTIGVLEDRERLEESRRQEVAITVPREPAQLAIDAIQAFLVKEPLIPTDRDMAITMLRQLAVAEALAEAGI